MTDIENQDFEWDLAEVITETRKQPTDDATVYLDENLSYMLSLLYDTLANVPTGEKDAIAKVEKQIAEVEAELDGKAYTIHLTAVPTRMREDIRSKALAKFPVKASSMFVDDNAIERQKYETVLSWLAQVTGVTNPKGQTRRLFDEESMESFYTSLPYAGQDHVNKKMQDLIKRSEQYVVRSKQVDFS